MFDRRVFSTTDILVPVAGGYHVWFFCSSVPPYTVHQLAMIESTECVYDFVGPSKPHGRGKEEGRLVQIYDLDDRVFVFFGCSWSLRTRGLLRIL